MNYRQIILLTIIILSVIGCSKPEIKKSTFEPISIGEFLDDWTCSVNPNSVSNFEIAKFRLWVPNPADVSNLKAILVLADHYNSDGLYLASSVEWQKYAKNNSLGILAVNFKSINGDYTEAFGGSGSALLMALEAITIRNRIPDVASLPFLMRGYSGGGMFCYHFSGFKPQRVIAFANIRGPIYSQFLNENVNIPCLMLLGGSDEPLRNRTAIDVVHANRIQNGLWSFAIEPNMDHYGSLDKSDELIKLFFTSALAIRVTAGTNELLPISIASGWLGNNVTKAIFSYATYPDNNNEASWLIDENFALKWRDYQLDYNKLQ